MSATRPAPAGSAGQLWWLLIAGGWLLVLLGTSPAQALRVLAVLVGSVAVHEAAHAVAVVALGAPVLGARIGAGPVFARIPVAGVPVELAPVPLAGHVVWQPQPGHLRRDHVVVSLAGPAANLVVAGVAAALLDPASPWFGLLVVFGASVAAYNLLPIELGPLSSAAHSDGRTALQWLRATPVQVTRAEAALALEGARAAWRSGHPDRAAELAAPVLERYGEQPATALLLADVDLARGRYRDAAARLEAALRGTAALEEGDRLWLADRLCLAVLRAAETGQLDGVSPAAALATAAWAGEVVTTILTQPTGEPAGTLALLRLHQGRPADARHLAVTAIRTLGADHPRQAAQHTVLAEAAAALGNAAEARQALTQAERFDPAEPRLPVARRAVAAGDPVTPSGQS